MIGIFLATKRIFTKIDCLRLYVPDLMEGIKYYHEKLGLPIKWRTDTSVGFLLDDKSGELVIQNEHNWSETDIKVDSVFEVIETIKKSGGTIKQQPFDIKIGKCAVVEDPWGNEMVLLDSTKGEFKTDSLGNIIGQSLS